MLTNKIEENILAVLRKEVEDKVTPEGYVEKGSVEIKDHGPLMTEVIRFRGYARVDVTFVANVCNPTKGDILECQVKRFNQFGIMGTAGPLNIVILESDKQVHVGQILEVRVVTRKLLLNDNQINVYSRLTSSKTEEDEVEIPDEELPTDNEKEDLTETDEEDLDETEPEDEDIPTDNEKDVEEEEDDGTDKEAQDGGYNLQYNVKDEEADGDYEETDQDAGEYMSDEDPPKSDEDLEGGDETVATEEETDNEFGK
jgi:DNA-directed RNA polymerase subunit E'/Rpb7